jgi:tRNA-uridine 2-sulfurtransferase
VVDKDVNRNVLIVGQGANHPRLFSNGLIANQLHWVDRLGPQTSIRCAVKTRYRQADISCEISPQPDGTLRVIFDQPQKAVTPGQSAVFYQGAVCLGGGIIENYIR